MVCSLTHTCLFGRSSCSSSPYYYNYNYSSYITSYSRFSSSSSSSSLSVCGQTLLPSSGRLYVLHLHRPDGVDLLQQEDANEHTHTMKFIIYRNNRVQLGALLRHIQYTW